MSSTDLSKYIVNPGPKSAVRGLKAACSTDSAIVTETVLKVMSEGGNAVDAAIAGVLVQAAVEPFMTNHTGTVTFLYYEAATGKLYQLDSVGTFPEGLAPFRPVPANAQRLRNFTAFGLHPRPHARAEGDPQEVRHEEVGLSLPGRHPLGGGGASGFDVRVPRKRLRNGLHHVFSGGTRILHAERLCSRMSANASAARQWQKRFARLRPKARTT